MWRISYVLLASFEVLNSNSMSPYCGRAQLQILFWMLGRIGPCLIWLAIANHTEFRFNFQNWIWDAKASGGQSEYIYICSFKWSHRSSQLCTLLNLEYCLYFEHIYCKVSLHISFWRPFFKTSLAIYYRYPIKVSDHIRPTFVKVSGLDSVTDLKWSPVFESC